MRLCASTPIQITVTLLREARLAVDVDERRASLGSRDGLLSGQTVDADIAGRATLRVKGSGVRPRAYPGRTRASLARVSGRARDPDREHRATPRGASGPTGDPRLAPHGQHVP